MGIGVFFSAVEFISGRQGARFHKMVNLLRVDDVVAGVGKIPTHPQKFPFKHGQVEVDGVEPAVITGAEYFPKLPGLVAEERLVSQLFVGETVDSRGFIGDFRFRIEENIVFHDPAVGLDLKVGELDHPVHIER